MIGIKAETRGTPWSYTCLVVLGGIITHAICGGLIMTPAILALDIVQELNESRLQVEGIGSIQFGFSLFIGLAVSYLLTVFSHRQIIIVGSLLTCFAYVVGSQSSDISVLLLYSVLGGCGIGMIYIPSFIAVTIACTKRRALAIGITLSGFGIGTSALSWLVEKLLTLYGWRGALLVLGAISLNNIVAAFLQSPLLMAVELSLELQERENDEDNDESQKSNDNVDSFLEKGTTSNKILRVRNEFEKIETQLPLSSEDEKETTNKNVDCSLCELNEFKYICSHENLVFLPRIDRLKKIDSIESVVEATKLNDSIQLIDKLKHQCSTPSLYPECHIEPDNDRKKTIIEDSQNRSHNLYLEQNVMQTNNVHKGGINLDFISPKVTYSSAYSSLSSKNESNHLKRNVLKRLYDILQKVFSSPAVTNTILCFRDKNFICLFLTFAVWCSYVAVIFYVPELIVTNGLEKTVAVTAISIYGFSNTAGRLLIGLVSTYSGIPNLILYGITLSLQTLAVFALPWVYDRAYFLLISIITGLCAGSCVTLRGLVLIDVMGIAVLTQSLCAVAVMQGLMIMFYQFLAGYLREATSSLFVPFTLIACLCFVSVVLTTYVYAVTRRAKLSKYNNT